MNTEAKENLYIAALRRNTSVIVATEDNLLKCAIYDVIV